MKKIFYIQIGSIIGLLLTMFVAQYYVIVYFSNISDLFTVGDLFAYLFVFLSLFFSFKRKIISSLIIVVYSIYFFLGTQDTLRTPIIIFKSISDGYYQFGFSLLFQLLNLIIGIILIALWLNRISLKDGQNN